MSGYDSILKEKKKEEKIEEKEKKFPKFKISFILIILVLIGSYVIYFNMFFESKMIVLNNYTKLVEKYKIISNNVLVNEFKNNKNFVGNIQYNEEIFDFNFIKNDGKLEFSLKNNDKYINYNLDNGEAYVKVPSVDEVISLNNDFSVNSLFELENIFNSIDSNKFVRNIYFENKKPIVEVSFSLDKNELNNLFRLGLKDEYKVIVTFKNDAIMNTLEEVKFSINNESKSDRRVINIWENNIVYKTLSDIYNLVLEENDNDFSIKINKNDSLYSVIMGSDGGDEYQVTYQIIDRVYNIKTIVKKINNGYLIDLVSKKDDLENKMVITLNIEDEYLIDFNVNNYIDVNNVLIKDKYINDINYFKDKLLEFVK